jgi:hypothetical protein
VVVLVAVVFQKLGMEEVEEAEGRKSSLMMGR